MAPEVTPAAYVGTAACTGCHPAATEAWNRSGHAKALSTLTEAQHGSDPECLTCHVKGFRQPGGWAGKSTPELDNVGCEACHGPGSVHAAAPAGTGARRYKGAPAGTGASACLTCHTRDNSPDFVWSGYWPQVEHGR